MTIVVALVFLVTALFTVFQAGRLLNVGFNYALDTGYCEYRTTPDKQGSEECSFNPDRAKKDVAEAGAILLVTAPAAMWAIRRNKNGA